MKLTLIGVIAVFVVYPSLSAYAMPIAPLATSAASSDLVLVGHGHHFGWHHGHGHHYGWNHGRHRGWYH